MSQTGLESDSNESNQSSDVGTGGAEGQLLPPPPGMGVDATTDTTEEVYVIRSGKTVKLIPKKYFI